MSRKPAEQAVKADMKCRKYIHGTCGLTIDQEFHTRIPMTCDPRAPWCRRSENHE